jgi:hypothetical protein
MISNIEYLIAVDSMLAEVRNNYRNLGDLSLSETEILGHVNAALSHVANAINDITVGYE